MKFLKSTTFWTHLLVFVLAVAVLYLPSLHSSFVLDDHIGIEQNQDIRSIDTVFNTPFTAFRSLLLHTSYSLGQLDPAYYRIMNFVFHLGTVVGIYILVGLVAESSVIAFFSALIFAVHPILVESVVWISSLTYPQYSFFVLVSLILYILKDKVRQKTLFIVLSLVAFFLSLMSSEKALILPLIILLYEWLFGSLKKNWKPITFSLLTLCVFGVIIFPFVQDRIAIFSASAVTGTTEIMNPLLQIPVVLGTYLNLIFWPERLTVYHLDEMGVQQSSLILNSLLTLLYFACLIVSYLKNKKIFFFLSIFFIASLPALIPIHIIQIAAERYAYLGTFGLIAAVVVGLFTLVKKYKINVIWLYVILSVCVIALGWRTIVRTWDWESEMSLRLATLKTAPYSARAHNNVGIQLMNEGRDDEALVEYKKAISMNPRYSHPYHNIGHMLSLRARYEEALPFYLKASQLNKFEWKTRQDLGQVYFMLGRYSESKEQIQMAIKQGSPEVLRLNAVLNRIRELGY